MYKRQAVILGDELAKRNNAIVGLAEFGFGASGIFTIYVEIAVIWDCCVCEDDEVGWENDWRMTSYPVDGGPFILPEDKEGAITARDAAFDDIELVVDCGSE